MDFMLLAGSRPTIDKDPAAALTYGRDVAGLLAPGDTVSTVTGQASGGVAASAPDFEGSVLRVKISGGTPGQMASYKFTWTTAGGDIDSRSIYFNVAAL